jgi:hypothetical protein
MDLDLMPPQQQIVRIKIVLIGISLFTVDLRLYISPSTSLLEATNVDDAQ